MIRFIQRLTLNLTLLGTLALLPVLAGCQLSDVATRMFFRNVAAYFSPGAESIEKFDSIDEALYSFRLDFDRNIILRTDAGLVIVDSFNDDFARALRKTLDREFPGVPVHTLIFSHYHLDHIGGARHLRPERVLTHKNSAAYWKDLDYVPTVAPTKTIAGDQTLRIGGESIQLLDLKKSHTDTLFAFYFKERKTLFAPDMGFVKTIVPGGLPDMYFPGYMAGLERLHALDFEHYVPSHFDMGTRQDLGDFLEFMRESRQLAHATMARHGRIQSSAVADKYFEDLYLPLKAKYGHWHGFNQMILPHLIRNFTGAYLGY